MNVRQTDIEAQKGKPGHRTMQQSKRFMWTLEWVGSSLPHATGVSYQA